MKSVVVVGKGPSVLDSSVEFISQFDEVAFCNFPLVKGYEKYIGTKCDYMFFNARDINLYPNDILTGLELKTLYNTHYSSVPSNYLPQPLQDLKIQYNDSFAKELRPSFMKQYDFDPSTGIMAFYAFVNAGYKKIGLVGFDFCEVGKKAYYYSVDEVQPSLRYLFGDNQPYSRDGTIQKESGHGSTERVKQFVKTLAKDNNIEIITPSEGKI